MNDSTVHNLPESISLDLDAFERPEDEVRPPFRAKVAGRVIEMEDPSNLDWRDLLLMENPTEFLRLALSKDDRKHLLEQDLPGWKFEQLMQTYYNHFDLDEKLAKARRQQALG